MAYFHHLFTAENISQFVFSFLQLLRPVLVFLLFSIFLVLLFLLVRQFLSLRKLLTDEFVLQVITPPDRIEKSAYATQQLFTVLHGLDLQKSFIQRLLGRKSYFAFEIVSTYEQGIRYLVRVRKQDSGNIKRIILSYMPYANVKTTPEYLPVKQASHHAQAVTFSLSRHYAYPLQKQEMLSKHDPVAYITGLMTKLKPTELIAFQMILSPVNKNETKKIASMILRNEDVQRYLDTIHFPILLFPFTVCKNVLSFLLSQLQWIVLELTRGNASQTSVQGHTSRLNPSKTQRIPSHFETEALQSIQEKVNQPLFSASIRMYVQMKTKREIKERIDGFTSSLAPFSVPQYQSLQKQNALLSLTDKIQLFLFKRRLDSLFWPQTVLSVAEISDLYHFPFTQVTQTENIVKIQSKVLPAPLSLKNNPQLDVVFAQNTFAGTKTAVGLTNSERARHMYIIGATGTGKSTMLLSMIAQDIKNGKGVCLIDPHGDLAEAVLKCLPESRAKDLIYFNPYDIAYPIGVNLLELTPGLSPDELLLEKEFIAESVISLFRKMFSDGGSGHAHRIEYILRNTIHTAFTLEHPTLFTIFEILNNPVFQKKAVAGLTDEHLKNFWKYEFGKAGDYQRVKMISPVTARIGRFLFSPSAKRILEQVTSTINFDAILSNKKILICNLAKGNIGEDTSEVMGILLLNKIQLACLKRARVELGKRENFYLYVDEFQNFATPSFVQMLSEARKYGLHLTMAEQSTSQQNDKNLVQIVLANTGTVVTFRSANPKDEELLLPQFRPHLEPGEIMNLPSFHCFIKKAGVTPEAPFSGETIPFAHKEDVSQVKYLLEASRKNYALDYASLLNTSKPEPLRQQPKRNNPHMHSTKTGLPE